ncbi:MAG: transglycosylase SLT domain-containing protein, partial [Chloroflexia bacterium]
MPQIPSNTRFGPRSPRARRVMALLMCAFTLLVLGSGSTSAQTTEGKDTTGHARVMHSFQVVARHWNVPLAVLMAVGWVESHWEQRNGDPALDGGYGIMHIVGGTSGTMERAVKLTGLTPESIRYFEEANIEAGAALLRDISRKAQKVGQKAARLADWYEVVAAYSGAPDPLVRDGYAQEVFRVIREGVSVTLSTGEVVTLPPTPVYDIPAPLPAPAREPDSDDYPPAAWVPAHPNNYTVGRPYPPLDKVIIHDTEGSYASAISWFQNPESR